MSKFLDNSIYGKNNWWRYLLTIIASWVGAILILAVLLIPILIISHPQPMEISHNIKDINPMFFLIFFGAYYILSFAIFYIFTRFIHHKNIRIFINTIYKIRWIKIVKGAGLWFFLMSCALLVEFTINPSSVRFSFNPSFFVLLILSVVIYSFQASFEEIFFRGYLMQAISILNKKPVIPLLITSLIFALGHFFNGSNVVMGVGMVINMFIFGLTLGIITLGENGLETAMGVHIANNFFLTTIIDSSGIFENLPTLLTIGSGSVIIIPSFILFPVLLFLIFRNKWDKFHNIFQNQYKLEKIGNSNQIHCKKCNTPNPEIASFCHECGIKLAYYASTTRKIIAFLIDIIFSFILSAILLIGIVTIHLVSNGGEYNTEMLAIVWIILSIIITFFYFVLFEKKGQTIGMKLTRIKVVTEKGQKPISLYQSIMRNILLIVDLIPFPLPGLLAVIFSSKSPKKQRIGDMVAETVVIKKL